MLFSLALTAEAGLPFMSKTVSWNEDVQLTDGQTLSVHRTATYGPDEWARSGRGPLKEQTIRFTHKGRKIEWENNDLWPIPYMPDILDIVSDTPVLVLPVHRWGPCEKYNFPQEGLVVFSYQNGRWSRSEISDLPKDLKVNLLRSTHAIQYWDEYKGKRITTLMKQDLERSGWGSTTQGQSISEASKFYAAYEDSCAHIRPLPDHQLDTAKKINSDAELNAQTVIATVTSLVVASEMITADQFRQSRGLWGLSDRCSGVVQKVEPVYQYGEKGGQRLSGFQFVLSGGRKVPIENVSTAEYRGIALLEQVICGDNTIYAVRRQGKDGLLIHRFRISGELIDAFRVVLPDTTAVIPGKGWGYLWDVRPMPNSLEFALTDYGYESVANLGGVIAKRQNYVVRFTR